VLFGCKSPYLFCCRCFLFVGCCVFVFYKIMQVTAALSNCTGMLPILSFIIGWVGLMHDDKRGSLTSPNEYWNLVSKLQHIQPEDGIEDFAPQLSNLIRTTRRHTATYNLERILLEKCTTNMMLGLRLYSCAKVRTCGVNKKNHLKYRPLKSIKRRKYCAIAYVSLVPRPHHAFWKI
jgi:hypothetical protein